MGLALALVDTYRRYKKGTENFVQWLAGTARATGTVDSVFAASLQEQVPAAGGRLKGKARKEAKKAGLATNTTTYQVSINTFVKLARAITDTSNIEVPHSVFATLSAVVRGRKDCAAWYVLNQDHANDTMKANNDRHQHFIEILEDTLQMLKKKQSQTKRSSIPAEDTCAKKVTNMFECLELEETEELEEIPESIPVTCKVEKDVEYKLKTSDADVSFAVYCFLKDLTNIRLFVRRAWREFKHGKIRLQAAALTMNAAIAMIERLSEDFQKAFPRFEETATEYMHPKIIGYVYQGYCSQQGEFQFLDVEDEEHDSFAYNEDGQKLHSSTVLCTHTTDIMLSLFLSKNPEKLRLSADEKRFVKCVSQLAAFFLSKAQRGKPYKDDMVHKAAWNMMNKPQLTTWNILALQILWDTQRELGGMLPIPHLLLEKTACDLAESYHKYLGTRGLNQVGQFHKTFRREMEARKDHIEAVAFSPQLQTWADKCEELAP
jgi:hypothetical protein